MFCCKTHYIKFMGQVLHTETLRKKDNIMQLPSTLQELLALNIQFEETPSSPGFCGASTPTVLVADLPDNWMIVVSGNRVEILDDSGCPAGFFETNQLETF